MKLSAFIIPLPLEGGEKTSFYQVETPQSAVFFPPLFSGPFAEASEKVTFPSSNNTNIYLIMD